MYELCIPHRIPRTWGNSRHQNNNERGARNLEERKGTKEISTKQGLTRTKYLLFPPPPLTPSYLMLHHPHLKHCTHLYIHPNPSSRRSITPDPSTHRSITPDPSTHRSITPNPSIRRSITPGARLSPTPCLRSAGSHRMPHPLGHTEWRAHCLAATTLFGIHTIHTFNDRFELISVTLNVPQSSINTFIVKFGIIHNKYILIDKCELITVTI